MQALNQQKPRRWRGGGGRRLFEMKLSPSLADRRGARPRKQTGPSEALEGIRQRSITQLGRFDLLHPDLPGGGSPGDCHGRLSETSCQGWGCIGLDSAPRRLDVSPPSHVSVACDGTRGEVRLGTVELHCGSTYERLCAMPRFSGLDSILNCKLATACVRLPKLCKLGRRQQLYILRAR